MLSSRLSRRAFLKTTALASGAIAFPWPARAEPNALARAAIARSPLVYVSPLKGNGEESTCHGEVWFVPDGGDLLVVTNPERWRAAAIGKGMDRARLWVGNFGVWKKAGDAFRKAPTFEARASIEKDKGVQAMALEAFGAKYAKEWDKWGPRFRDGLASGERVLIRYSPTT